MMISTASGMMRREASKSACDGWTTMMLRMTKKAIEE